ncbi:Nucleoporin GLE1 [Nymphon striatum]|nr:Nucleoporin GLE1 [Nymphon striatum]
MDVISSLKQTSKGRLKYDRDALSGCNAKRTIERIYDGNLSISVRFNPKKPQVSRKVKISKNLSPINFQNSYYEDFDDCQLEVNDSFNDIMDYENTRKSYVNNAMDLKIRFFNENYENIQTKAEQSLKVLNHEKALQQMKKLEKLKHRHDKGVRTAFDRKEKGESAALMEEVMKCLESLESLWGDFESGLGVTARLWSMYIDMMLILRRYIHAERAGLWQQHLQEVRNMLPYTIASGHSKYMSCLPIYLNEMQKLPETAPEVHEEFAAGKFTVHQTAGDFNGVWTNLAMAFIQRFNTLGSSTFGQLQERYRDKLLNMKPRHCTEVHFVGDQYDFELKSLKSDERQRQESNINLPEYVPADSMKIPDWKTLLSNPCNRTNMLSYLASRWSQEASWPAGFCLVLGVNAQATRVTQTEHTDVDELYCPNHEEADTRIFAHIASCDDNNVFVIQATDTDIIFLAMYHFPRLPNVVELWVEKNDLFLSIHDLVNELAKAVGKDGLALTDTLLISYILSGCDSVSYPFKRGKKRTVKVALEHVDKHPTLSNCIRHESGPFAHDQVITEARSFFCDLYGKPGYLSLDKLRAHLFASSKLDLRSLPPTEDAFHFHVLRSLCQICLYKQASLSNPVLLPPEEYGRIVDGDRLIPVMKSKPSKPSAAKLKYCKCKKKPNCLRNCPCAKAAVPCIIACACNGDREKCERLLADHYDDDDDEEEEIVLMTLFLKEAFEVKKKQQENSKQHLKLLHEKIKQAEMKQKIREEEKQSQEMERQGRLSVVMEGLVITSNFLAQMKSQIDNCESREYISPECYEAVNHVLINCGKIKNIVAQAEKGVVLTDEDISLVQMTVAKLSSTLQTVTLHIEIANGEAEKALKLKTEAQTSKKEIKSSIKFESIDKKETEKKLIKNELLEYVSIDCLKNNVRLKENLKMCQDSISSFVNDPNLKKYRFQLQKAVNTTVNTIGNTSGSHLKEKLNHLHSLMSGQSVEVGGKMVSPSQHELGLKFCKELLAKKLVRQGEEQVASNHDSAFAFAMVIVAVSTDFPDIGDLIIAHFYERCPYLVPYYIPRQEGQSDEEHYRELGYHFVDGVIEKQDKFLKRMSGMVRLYAATIASKPPPKRYETPKHNIHGLRFGWKWLAEVLNLDPRPDITATLLFNFLEVAGHEMSNIYKTQFQKLLHAMCREFFPKIKAVTPDGSGGPVLRLETLLQKAISKQGRFPKPSGCIDSKFWST